MARGRAQEAVRSLLDPELWVYVVRLLNFLFVGHVKGRRAATMGAAVRVSPTATFRNGERVSIGARSHIGENCALWAGDSVGRISLGEDCLLGPGVYITASNYGVEPGTPVMCQPKDEHDVVLGADVWLGANVVVLPGVTIGDGCVVGAGSVVTKTLPAGSIAVGSPARVVGERTTT